MNLFLSTDIFQLFTGPVVFTDDELECHMGDIIKPYVENAEVDVLNLKIDILTDHEEELVMKKDKFTLRNIVEGVRRVTYWHQYTSIWVKSHPQNGKHQLYCCSD